MLTALAFASTFLGVPLLTFLPVIARDVFDQGVGLYSMAAGLLRGRRGDRRPRRRLAGPHAPDGANVAEPRRRSSAAHADRVRRVSGPLALRSALLFVASGLLMVVLSMLTSLVQLIAPDHMRGRVMSIYMMAFRGGMPLGSLAVGYVASLVPAARGTRRFERHPPLRRGGVRAGAPASRSMKDTGSDDRQHDEQRLAADPQPAHARLAAAMWRRGRPTGSPTVRHATPWSSRRRTTTTGGRSRTHEPRWDPGSAGPYDFVSLPHGPRQAIWRRAIPRVGPLSRYAAALVAQHAVTITRTSRVDPSGPRFLAEMERLRDDWFTAEPRTGRRANRSTVRRSASRSSATTPSWRWATCCP